MPRHGMTLALRSLVILVILGILVVLVAMSFMNHIFTFGQNSDASANSSALRNCEENINGFCKYNPDANWGETYTHCTQYKDVIDDNGDTIC